jgi:hypothetical protein
MVKSRSQRRRRQSNRPRILRYRWWFILRSPRRTRIAVFVLGLGTFVTFSLVRRRVAQRHEPPGLYAQPQDFAVASSEATAVATPSG